MRRAISSMICCCHKYVIKSNKQFHHVSNQLFQAQIALLKYLPNVIWSNFIDDFLTNKKILKCFIDKWWIKLDSKNSWGVSRIIDKLLYLFFWNLQNHFSVNHIQTIFLAYNKNFGYPGYIQEIFHIKNIQEFILISRSLSGGGHPDYNTLIHPHRRSDTPWYLKERKCNLRGSSRSSDRHR